MPFSYGDGRGRRTPKPLFNDCQFSKLGGTATFHSRHIEEHWQGFAPCIARTPLEPSISLEDTSTRAYPITHNVYYCRLGDLLRISISKRLAIRHSRCLLRCSVSFTTEIMVSFPPQCSMVPMEGLEPSTDGLKGRYSTN